MKRTLLAAAILAGVSGAALAADPPQVPKHKCEPKPVLPGPTLRRDAMVVKRFQREIDEYKNCMKAYADDRAAHSKAHTEAGNAAINEYNATMKEIQEAQKAQ
jgi:hypothetical protein